MSRRYTRLLTLVRTFLLCLEIPSSKALRLFLTFFKEGVLSNQVVGTVLKYGS